MSQCGGGKARPFVSAREASKQLGGRPSHTTLANAAKAGKLPGAKIVAGRILISQRWIDETVGWKPPDFLK